MKIVILYICAFFSTIACAGNLNFIANQNDLPDENASNVLVGSWQLKVENLRHEVIATMNVKFLEEQAKSCIGGTWKRIVVESHNTSNKNFFPVSEPLSYEIQHNS
ncbi:hypothetical protein BH11PSE12_BH11PSE12_34400 [soil metagenome]